jgi:hypothetical protein
MMASVSLIVSMPRPPFAIDIDELDAAAVGSADVEGAMIKRCVVAGAENADLRGAHAWKDQPICRAALGAGFVDGGVSARPEIKIVARPAGQARAPARTRQPRRQTDKRPDGALHLRRVPAKRRRGGGYNRVGISAVRWPPDRRGRRPAPRSSSRNRPSPRRFPAADWR